MLWEGRRIQIELQAANLQRLGSISNHDGRSIECLLLETAEDAVTDVMYHTQANNNVQRKGESE